MVLQLYIYLQSTSLCHDHIPTDEYIRIYINICNNPLRNHVLLGVSS